ncbi:MAG: S-layer homology domain-containing protein [Oscillospiraceae bacterium]|nr:S-layer homology domain-containing protein [Clostridiales bacterium]
MKKKRILALFLAAVSCLSLAVSASAAGTTPREATDFKDYDRTAWYAEAVSAAVDNGLLYGKSSTTLDPNGDMTRAEMAAIINRSFGCYKVADISQYKDVSKSKWYYKDVALAVQMGTYNGRSNSSMAPDAPISRQEAMTVVARALELEYDTYAKTDLSAFSDRSEISNWALPYVRAMVGADYIHGRGKVLAPLDNITRAEFAQIFANIIGTYIVSKGTYDKDIKGSVLIRTDDVELKNLTVDGDLIIGCGAADGKITLDNVTVKGRLLVWGGGTKAVYCNAGTNMPAVVVARVDDAVKVIYDRDSTLAVIDTIKVRITERAKQHKETEVIFYDVSGLREAQKQLNAIVADNQIDITAPAHLYALVGESSVKAEFRNNSKGDTYKVEIRRNKDNALIADAFELAAGKSISTLTLLEAPEFGNVDCTVIVTAFRDGKQIGTLNTELTLHTAYLWPKEVQ